MEIAEGAVPGAEIVHGKGDTERAQVFHYIHRGLLIGNEAGLSHLQPKFAAACTGLREQRFHMVRQALAEKLPGGQIHANTGRSVARVLPSPVLNLLAGFGQTPVADGENHPAFLSYGNELVGRNQATFWMSPANE